MRTGPVASGWHHGLAVRATDDVDAAPRLHGHPTAIRLCCLGQVRIGELGYAQQTSFLLRSLLHESLLPFGPELLASFSLTWKVKHGSHAQLI